MSREEPYHEHDVELNIDANTWQAQQLREFLQPTGSKMLVVEPPIHDVLSQQPVSHDIADELWSIDEDETVRHAHLMFHDAGADVALTNTRHATRPHLEHVSDALSPARFARSAVQQAFSAGPQYVFGAVGPTGLDVALKRAAAQSAYEELFGALLAEGVHGIYLENMQSTVELSCALEAAYRRENRSLVVGLKLDEQGRLSDGLSVLDALELAAEHGANCLNVGAMHAEQALGLVESVSKVAQARGMSLALSLDVDDTVEPAGHEQLEQVVANLAARGVTLISVAAGHRLTATSRLAEAVAVAVGSNA
ncbi:MAG: homocysteine S-methyltransferase family protein [Atopobiaceae bacterium]|nr:homocysteine S-methyltransferase family protein [Atopobiaceae bacterium]